MEALKLIPSVFFDLISRVVTGSVAIVCLLLFYGRDWHSFLLEILGGSFADGTGELTAIGLFFYSAYVAGHLLAPFAKAAQRIGELSWLRPKSRAPEGAYDFLRIHYPNAGAQCAKIRAEFTMFNGLFVVFLALFVATWICPYTSIPVGGFPIFLIAVATAVRGRTVRDTFEKTVAKCAKAVDFPNRAGQAPASATG